MAVENNRWGILFCPHRGLKSSRKQWNSIEKALVKHDVLYDFVQSESQDSVYRLMRMMVSNGYKTIIIVGGDSALNDAVNCLMDFEQRVRNEVSIGIIPNGIANDFARFWGFHENNIEQTVEWLAARRVRKVDVGCLRYRDKNNESHCHYFLNCVNIGLSADLMNVKRQTRSLLGSRTLSKLFSSILMLFHRMDYKMDMKINATTIRRRVMTVCVGSGPGYGQTPNAVPYSGLLDVSVVYQPGITQLIAGLWLLFFGRFLTHRSVHPFRTREVVVNESKHACVSVDGRLVKRPHGDYRITIEPEMINFLIPV